MTLTLRSTRPDRRTRGRRRAARLVTAAVAALIALLTLLVAGPVSPAAAKLPADIPRPTCALGDCQVGATPDGFQYVFVNGVLKRVPATVNVGGKQLDFVPACTSVVDCFGPGNTCTLNQLLAGYLVDPNGGNPNVAACQAPAAGPALDIGVIEADLTRYLREKALPKPVLKIQPDARSFTNLPTIFWLPDPATFTLPVTQPIAATITAVPHYRWDFGDGTTGPDSPGRPYDPGVSPRTDPTFYVAHAYAKPGRYQVTLTVTWAGTFTVAGAAQAFPLGAVNLAANAPVVVGEAAGVLTGNG